ncbi:MAG TPA: DUF2959 family protein [Candidatus Polarisedimenticolia bacterium]|nr:DUF2959 family protein [Candidatus Polarisedimenticolia bacterium]
MSRRVSARGLMRAVLAAALVVCTAGVAAPLHAATSPEKAEKLAARMLDVEALLDKAANQLAATLDSMNAISAAKPEDLAARYEDFHDNFATLGSMAKKARSSAEKAASDRGAYLKKWQSAQDKIQNEQLKAASQARRDELMPMIDAIHGSLTSARDTFYPLMQSLKDLDLYLGNNLSQQGISLSGNLMAKCTSDGAAVKADIDRGREAIKALSSNIRPGAGASR